MEANTVTKPRASVTRHRSRIDRPRDAFDRLRRHQAGLRRLAVETGRPDIAAAVLTEEAMVAALEATAGGRGGR